MGILEIIVSVLWLLDVGGPMSPSTSRPVSDPMGYSQWYMSESVGSWNIEGKAHTDMIIVAPGTVIEVS